VAGLKVLRLGLPSGILNGSSRTILFRALFAAFGEASRRRRIESKVNLWRVRFSNS